MKKVAIMTINSLNFGNRLQNFALQKTIESLGYSVETIRRTGYLWDDNSLTTKIGDTIKRFLGTQKGLFIRFDKQNITYSSYIASPNYINDSIDNEYDYFVVGSDQVWNPYYSHRVGSTDLLLFTPGRKRISYAASFGVDAIPFEKKENFRSALKDFKAISVRESSGVAIVNELINKEAFLALDPTLLLNKTEWEKISVKPRTEPRNRYILVYTLGELPAYIESYINEHSKKNGLTVYDISQRSTTRKNTAIGPSEFLWLIDHADHVVTDSFHATVFSIIFHIKVRTFQREGLDMSSRIRSLAEMLDVSDHFDDRGSFILEENEKTNEIDKILKDKIEKSIGFLKQSLED